MSSSPDLTARKGGEDLPPSRLPFAGHFANRNPFSNRSDSLVAVLRKAFDSFDREKSGSIPTDMVADILRLMGQPFNKKILDELIEEVDADSK